MVELRVDSSAVGWVDSMVALMVEQRAAQMVVLWVEP